MCGEDFSTGCFILANHLKRNRGNKRRAGSISDQSPPKVEVLGSLIKWFIDETPHFYFFDGKFIDELVICATSELLAQIDADAGLWATVV